MSRKFIKQMLESNKWIVLNLKNREKVLQTNAIVKTLLWSDMIYEVQVLVLIGRVERRVQSTGMYQNHKSIRECANEKNFAQESHRNKQELRSG